MSESPQQTGPGTIIPESIVIDTDIVENGQPIRLCLRPLSESDHDRIERGIMGLSQQSRYLRFFSGFKSAPRNLVEQLTAVDGMNHIGWGAVNLGIERSEEHTSELQSRPHLVCRLLLEKKKRSTRCT